MLNLFKECKEFWARPYFDFKKRILQSTQAKMVNKRLTSPSKNSFLVVFFTERGLANGFSNETKMREKKILLTILKIGKVETISLDDIGLDSSRESI